MSLYISGTVNIHPSLLPLYRGAAPVQRALQVCVLSLLQFWACETMEYFIYIKLSTISVGWCCRNRCFPCIYCSCLGCRSSDRLRKFFCWWLHQGRSRPLSCQFDGSSWQFKVIQKQLQFFDVDIWSLKAFYLNATSQIISGFSVALQSYNITMKTSNYTSIVHFKISLCLGNENGFSLSKKLVQMDHHCTFGGLSICVSAEHKNVGNLSLEQHNWTGMICYLFDNLLYDASLQEFG